MRNSIAVLRTNVLAVSSNATSIGGYYIACMGFAAYSDNKDLPLSISATDVTLHSSGCNVSAVGGGAVACMGFALYTSVAGSSLTAARVALHASGSNVSATGSDSCVACMGFASLSSLSVCSILASNTIVHASDCMLSAAGSSSVACMGFSAFDKTMYNLESKVSFGITNLVLYASGCYAVATGVDAVACVGFASGWNGCVYSVSSIEASNVSLCASRSSVTANGRSSVAAMGFVFSSQKTSSIAAKNISVSAVECTVVTRGISADRSAFVSVGFASNGLNYQQSNVLVQAFTLYASLSTITTTTPSGYCIASMGISLYSGSSSTIVKDTSVYATESIITASGRSFLACMGIASYSSFSATDATLYASGCNASALGTAETVVCMGFISMRNSITVLRATVFAASSNATSIGGYYIACMGFVAYSDNRDAPLSISATDVTLHSSACNVSAVGGGAVACMGFALYTSVAGSSLTAARVALHASGSKVSAIGSDSCVACMGFASLSSLSVCSIVASNTIVHASDSMLSAAGSSSVACMGFSAFDKTQSNSEAKVSFVTTNLVLYASGCYAVATGTDAVACVGFASGWNGCVYSLSSIEASNVSLCASRSSVTANGRSSVAAMGFVFSSQKTSSIAAKNISVSAVECTVVVHGIDDRHGFVSVGFASFGLSYQQSNVLVQAVTLYASLSTITAATSSGYCIASMGISLYSGTSSTIVKDTSVYATESIITASGRSFLACMGIASSSSFSATDTTLYASGCNASALGTAETVVCMGIAISSCTSKVFTRLLFVFCTSRAVVSGVAYVGMLAVVSSCTHQLADARWVALQSRMEVAGGTCMTIPPSSSLPNVAVDVDVVGCTSIGGWATPLPFCGANVAVNGGPLKASLMPSSLTESACLAHRTTRCASLFPEPVILLPQLPAVALPPPPDVFVPILPSIALPVMPAWLLCVSSRLAVRSSITQRVSPSASAPSASLSTRLSFSDSVVPSVSTHAMPSVTLTGTSPSSTASSSLLSVSSPVSVSASVLDHPVEGTHDAARVASTLIGSEAATAIVRSGAASVAVASIFAMPSVATYASRVDSLAKVVDCGFASHIEADAVPDPFEHPFYFALGSSNLRNYGGAAVLTLLLFILLPCLPVAATHWLLGEAPQDHPTLCRLQRYVCGVLASLFFGYFGPSVVGASVMLISFGDSGVLFVGALLFVAVIAAWCALIAGLWWLPLQAGGRAAWDFRRRLCVTMWIFAEGAAQLSRMTSRLYYVEEVFISCALAAVVNAPSIRGSCTPAALAVIVLCAAHVAFQALCRPYEALLDTIFSLVDGFLQLLLAIVNFALLQGASGVADDIAGCVVLALSCLFVLQAAISIVTACTSLFHFCAEKSATPAFGLSCEDFGSDGDGGGCGALSVPMTANPLIDAASQHHREE